MGRPPCHTAQTPQNIVEQPKGHAHERCKKKLLPLKRQRQLHYRNSRWNSPPPFCVSS